MSKADTRSELRWVLAWAVAIVLLSSLPYLWGMLITPPGLHFLGLTHNIDDGAVYLSWMRQAADGSFFISNLFTGEPQPARAFNVLFLVMGSLARLSHLPLIWVFHLFRAVLGMALIVAVWRFSRLFMEDARDRRLLVPVVGLSSGLGWLIPGAKAPSGPVDVWQPEAITFLSIYLNPLFTAGLLLMLGTFYFLTLAQRTGRARYAAAAGIAILLLGNIHTYDVVTVACVWTAYLAALWVIERSFPTRPAALSAIAALIGAPSIAWQYHIYRMDEVFRARANTEILSPPVWCFFAGYGLVLLGAIAGGVMLVRAWRAAKRGARLYAPPALLLFAWSVVGFAVPYIPVAQQRKLVMGLHIPLCILCACALSRMLARLPGGVGRLALVGLVILAAGSNARFMAIDTSLLSIGRTVTIYSPFVGSSEFAAMRWLRENLRQDDVVFAPPDFALFTPAIAGRRVCYGHWSETPDYTGRIRQWLMFVDGSTSAEAREEILRKNRANFLIWVDTGMPAGVEYPSAQLGEVFSDGHVSVFRAP